MEGEIEKANAEVRTKDCDQGRRTLLNLTHMLWANGVVAQGHRQQQHVKKVFHPDLTSNLREREEERERERG